MIQIHIDTEGRKPIGELPPEQQEKIRVAVERFLRRLESDKRRKDDATGARASD